MGRESEASPDSRFSDAGRPSLRRRSYLNLFAKEGSEGKARQIKTVVRAQRKNRSGGHPQCKRGGSVQKGKKRPGKE